MFTHAVGPRLMLTAAWFPLNTVLHVQQSELPAALTLKFGG